jgi:uncharacterized membrane protein
LITSEQAHRFCKEQNKQKERKQVKLTPTISIIAVVAAIAGAVLLQSSATLAQSGGGYGITAFSLNSGGTSSGGDYTLASVIGQPYAGQISGGSYTLAGGFLPAIGNSSGGNDQSVYLPMILK